jgi:hypothetical protein
VLQAVSTCGYAKGCEVAGPDLVHNCKGNKWITWTRPSAPQPKRLTHYQHCSVVLWLIHNCSDAPLYRRSPHNKCASFAQYGRQAVALLLHLSPPHPPTPPVPSCTCSGNRALSQHPMFAGHIRPHQDGTHLLRCPKPGTLIPLHDSVSSSSSSSSFAYHFSYMQCDTRPKQHTLARLWASGAIPPSRNLLSSVRVRYCWLTLLTWQNSISLFAAPPPRWC